MATLLSAKRHGASGEPRTFELVEVGAKRLHPINTATPQGTKMHKQLACDLHIICYILGKVMEDRPPAKIEWEGDSKEVLSSFPHDVKATLGFSLRQIQNGNHPRCAHRSMSSVGKGVMGIEGQR